MGPFRVPWPFFVPYLLHSHNQGTKFHQGTQFGLLVGRAVGPEFAAD